MKKLLAILLTLTLLLALAACNKKPAAPADAPDVPADVTPEPAAPDEPDEPAEPEQTDGEVGMISTVTQYLAQCNLAEELVFPGGADGSVVTNSQLHFNPHGAVFDDWVNQLDMAIMMVADDGVIEGSSKDGAKASINSTAYTFTCGVISDEEWFFQIAK